MANIPIKYIPHIEKALGIKLYDNQKAYLLDGLYISGGRRMGKTTAFCIRLALSEGEPLNMKKPWEFSDGQELADTRRYALVFFRRYFIEIRESLMNYGFKVRDINKGE